MNKRSNDDKQKENCSCNFWHSRTDNNKQSDMAGFQTCLSILVICKFFLRSNKKSMDYPDNANFELYLQSKENNSTV